MALLLAALAAVWLALPHRATPSAHADVAATASTTPAAAVPPPIELPASAALPDAVMAMPTPALSAAPAQSPVAAPMTTARTEPPAKTRPAPREGTKPLGRPSVPPSAPQVAAEPAAAPPQPVAPAPVATPETGALCADRRFIAHAVCLQAECDKPSMRQHPQCVRMREQQDALRRGSGEG